MRIAPLMALTLLLAANGAPAKAGVCPPPGAFAESRIDSNWIGVVLQFKGASGDPHIATVYTTRWTHDGVQLTSLGTVKAIGERASALHVFFFRDKLYAVNDSYVRNPANSQEDVAFALQRFGIGGGDLVPEAHGFATPALFAYRLVGPGTGGNGCDTSRMDAALEHAIEAGTFDRIWRSPLYYRAH